MSDFTVKIEYKNKAPDGSLQTVVEKEYDFIDYTYLLYKDLMDIIKMVENSFYEFEEGKEKKDWNPKRAKMFQDIRHKMLDEANAIRRLPQNLSHLGVKADQIPAGEYFLKKLP